MGRVHLFEIHDQPWCPAAVRDGITDLIQTALAWFRAYDAITPLLADALRRTGAHRVVDLASGSGGPWRRLREDLARRGVDVTVLLTDKFPNRQARTAAGPVAAGIAFHPEPVDATIPPEALPGFRTMFTAFHHFRPAAARAVLADAVRRGEGIAIFEVTRRAPVAICLTLLGVIAVLVATPFVRPFRWDRLLLTYLVPVLPLAGTFDGFVSNLRTYSPPELRRLVADLPDYEWRVGLARHRVLPLHVTWLVGTPPPRLSAVLHRG